jgi:hypothetical protein
MFFPIFQAGMDEGSGKKEVTDIDYMLFVKIIYITIFRFQETHHIAINISSFQR